MWKPNRYKFYFYKKNDNWLVHHQKGISNRHEYMQLHLWWKWQIKLKLFVKKNTLNLSVFKEEQLSNFYFSIGRRLSFLGKESVIFVPTPCVLAISIFALCSRIILSIIIIPRPLPFPFVEKYG